jgi:predicted dehydrogenase
VIRLGIIGNGHRMACLMGDAMRAAEPEFRVVGVVDPAEAFIRQRLKDWGCEDQKDVPFYPDLKTLVRKAKPDGLLIGTGCQLHTPYAIQAADYDLPLFLEKPVSTSMAQALALERAFRRTRCEVVVSFPLRVSPLCVRAQQVIADGTIGHPEHIAGLHPSCYYGPGAAAMQGLFLRGHARPRLHDVPDGVARHAPRRHRVAQACLAGRSARG